MGSCSGQQGAFLGVCAAAEVNEPSYIFAVVHLRFFHILQHLNDEISFILSCFGDCCCFVQTHWPSWEGGKPSCLAPQSSLGFGAAPRQYRDACPAPLLGFGVPDNDKVRKDWNRKAKTGPCWSLQPCLQPPGTRGLVGLC